MKSKKHFLLITLLLGIILLSLGCNEKPLKQSKPKNKAPKQQRKQEKKGKPRKQSGGGKKIFMMGRSTMNGWLRTWSPEDPYKPIKKNNFTFIYKELSTPPDIVASVKDYLKEADSDTIIFFKLCFEDFTGGSKEEARANRLRNQGYVKQVYDEVVTKKHLKLIIGNALPQVEQVTDEFMVDNHKLYNEWLEDFAGEHQGEVYIFDQYEVLAGEDGSLKTEYETSADDSHPNEAGYEAMDKPFFELLQEANTP